MSLYHDPELMVIVAIMLFAMTIVGVLLVMDHRATRKHDEEFKRYARRYPDGK